MLKVIKGDITAVEEGVIIQQVNCQNVMGSGVAKAIYTKYPVVKKEYHTFCEGKEPNSLLGSVQYTRVSDRILVVNLFSQLNYGYDKSMVYTNYPCFESCVYRIDKARLDTRELGYDFNIYAPYGIGCGLANGDWNIISDILDKYGVTVVKL